jgi:Rap1a immunity proteins
MMGNCLSASILAACALWSVAGHCEEDLSGNSFMAGCRFNIERGGTAYAREMQLVYDSGRCNGFVTAIALTDLGVCLPPGATIDQMLRIVVRYVDGRPERAHEHFASLARDALTAAWPCKR